jgi:LCP family protein required for cell wall assembly
MSDKQNPDDPRFDWLYGGGESQREPADPDSTQVFPAGRDQGPEPTQILDVSGGQQGPPPPAGEAAGQSPQSFGGTYAATPQPQRRPPPAGPAFAPPARQDPLESKGPPPRDVPGTSTPPSGPRRRKWILRGILVLLLAWVAFLVLVPVYAYSKITKVDAEPSGERPADSAGTTYLLVGSDSRAELSDEERQQLGTGAAEGQRTDTIMLLHVPSGDGPNLLLSIPRDSFVPIPGQDENKINAAYAFGGPELLVQTVEGATGVHVDNYIEIGFGGFVELVDAVGGIEICPERAINDPKAGGLDLEKGCQEVDGVTALGYSRSRAFARGDITRAEHQREVIAAVGDEAASWQSVVLPWRYWSLNMAAAETLTVGENVGPIDLARFAWAMSHTSGGDAKRCVVPYSDLGASTSAGSVVLWDEQRADALFEAVREDDTASIKCAPR